MGTERKFQKYCAVEECGEIAHTSTNMATNEVAREHLEIARSADSDTIPLALCNPHYLKLYTGQLDFQQHVQHVRHGHGIVEITLDDLQTPFKSQHTYSRQWISKASFLLSAKSANSAMTSIEGVQQQNAGESTSVSTLHDIEH